MLEFAEKKVIPLRFEFVEEEKGFPVKFCFEEKKEHLTKIKVIGIGGGGGNAVNRMLSSHLGDVEFVVLNTDIQALQSSRVPQRVQIGSRLTKGLGAGTNPEIGKKAALEDRELITEVLKNTDVVFLTAGLGGGTGTGAMPVVAEIARELGILTIGVVTKPFTFEGSKRMRQAEEGLKELKGEVDALIAIPNDQLLEVVERDTSLIGAFRVADDILKEGVKSIVDLIVIPGLINLDLADLKAVMQGAGSAMMGVGRGQNEGRAISATQEALSGSLLEETTIERAKGIVFNVTGGEGLTLAEVEEVASIIQEAADKDANIIFGAVISEEMGEEIKVVVIATKFDFKKEEVSMHERRVISIKEEKFNKREIVSYEDLDIPTFLRRKTGERRLKEPCNGLTER